MLKKITIAIYITSLLILSLVAVLGVIYNIPFEKFTGDPAMITNSNPFVGVVSNLGILLWCTTSSICFFSGSIIYNIDKKSALFLIFSGVFSTILLFDDFFMIHDYAIYYLVSSDNGQYAILTLYAIFSILYLLRFYKIIIEGNYFILGLAFIFLGLSVVIDMIFESSGLEYFIEDSFKFLGIVSWTLFFSYTSYKYINKIKI